MSSPPLQDPVHSTNKSLISEPRDNASQTAIYILPAILIGTLALLFNVLQAIALCRKSPKVSHHVPRLLLALMGVSSCVPTFWYVAVVAQSKMESASFLFRRELCFLLPSGFLVFPLLGTGLTFNYHALDAYFKSCKVKPNATRKFTLCVACFAGILAMLPSCGWNTWQGVCCLPHVWSRSFVLFLTVNYFLHLFFNIIILAWSITVNSKQSQMVVPTISGVPAALVIPDNNHQKTFLAIVALAIQFATTVPVVLTAGNIKVGEIQVSQRDCTAEPSMSWAVLSFTGLAVFLPIWNLIMDVEHRESVLALFFPK